MTKQGRKGKTKDHTTRLGGQLRKDNAAHIRTVIDELILLSPTDDYASISALLGRNHAYIQQYIKRGTPRTLKVEDRRRIAEHFGVAPDVLDVPMIERTIQMPQSNPDDHQAQSDQLVHVLYHRRSDHQAPSNRGGDVPVMAFSQSLLKSFTGGKDPDTILLIAIDGDAMSPTLNPGDLALVVMDKDEPLRDGVYAIRTHEEIVVRRISITPHPSGKGAIRSDTVIVSSDSPDYPGWQNYGVDTLDIMGRIVWSGRKL